VPTLNAIARPISELDGPKISHSCLYLKNRFMVGLGGLEPLTSPLSELRSLVLYEEFNLCLLFAGAVMYFKETSLKDRELRIQLTLLP